MPILVACPSCGQSISAHESTAGQVIGCPNCRQALTVPAATEPEGADFEFRTKSPRRTARAPEAKGKWVLVGGAVAVVAAVAVVVALALGGSSKREQTDAQVDEVCLLIRQQALTQQVGFWNFRVAPDDMKELLAESDRVAGLLEASEKKNDARWGSDRKKLVQLKPELRDPFGRFVEGTNKAVADTLAAHGKLSDAEHAQLRAKLAAENPLVLPEKPKFDRNTVSGQRASDEWDILQPALDKKAQAERKLLIERGFAAGVSALNRKRIAACREQCGKLVAALEQEFRK